MNTAQNTSALGSALVAQASGAPAGPAVDAAGDPLLKELLGETPASRRTQGEWEAVYAKVVQSLLATPDPAPKAGSARGSRYSADPGPRLMLERIIVRAGAPPAESRAALVKVLLEHLAKTDRVNDQVFLLRQLAVVGHGESVSALTGLLGHQSRALREFALRALESNSSAEAGKAIVTALGQAKDDASRAALAGALGARREAAALGALTALVGDRSPEVAQAAMAALGNIGTAEAAQVLGSARKSVSQDRESSLSRACLLCADRLRTAGATQEAAAMYRDVYSVQTPLLRMAALRGLVLTQAKDALPLVVEALKSEDAEVQSQAARFAVELPAGAETTKALFGALPTLKPGARARLLEALAERGAKDRKSPQ